MISPDLRATLKALKLGQMLDTLPERLTLARQQKHDPRRLPRARPGRRGHPPRIQARPRCGPAPPGWTRACASTPGTRPPPSATTSSCGTNCLSLRFLDGPHGASDPRAGRRRQNPPGHRARATSPSAAAAPSTWHRADKLFKRLKAARLDNSTEAEMRRLAGVDLLILDDFALQPLDADRDRRLLRALSSNATSRASTIVTSNRTPDEWLAIMADPLLAQSAVDRLTSTAHELDHRRRVLPAPPETIDQPHRRRVR